jgi:hypothetical protein
MDYHITQMRTTDTPYHYRLVRRIHSLACSCWDWLFRLSLGGKFAGAAQYSILVGLAFLEYSSDPFDRSKPPPAFPS